MLAYSVLYVKVARLPLLVPSPGSSYFVPDFFGLPRSVDLPVVGVLFFLSTFWGGLPLPRPARVQVTYMCMIFRNA